MAKLWDDRPQVGPKPWNEDQSNLDEFAGKDRARQQMAGFLNDERRARQARRPMPEPVEQGSGWVDQKPLKHFGQSAADRMVDAELSKREMPSSLVEMEAEIDRLAERGIDVSQHRAVLAKLRTVG